MAIITGATTAKSDCVITEERAREVLKEIEKYLLSCKKYKIRSVFENKKYTDTIYIDESSIIGYWKGAAAIRFDFVGKFVESLTDDELDSLSLLSPFGVFRDCVWGTLNIHEEKEIKDLLDLFKSIAGYKEEKPAETEEVKQEEAPKENAQ